MSQVDSETVVVLRTEIGDAKEELQAVSKKLTNMRFRVPETFEPEIRQLRDTVLGVIRQLETARITLRRGIYEEEHEPQKGAAHARKENPKRRPPSR